MDGMGQSHMISHTVQLGIHRAYERVVSNLVTGKIFNNLSKPIIFATTHNIFQEFQEFQVLSPEALEAMLDRH